LGLWDIGSSFPNLTKKPKNQKTKKTKPKKPLENNYKKAGKKSRTQSVCQVTHTMDSALASGKKTQ
jgi:hypothetical protein